VLFSMDWVIILYFLNALLVSGDFMLYCYYVKKAPNHVIYSV